MSISKNIPLRLSILTILYALKCEKKSADVTELIGKIGREVGDYNDLNVVMPMMERLEELVVDEFGNVPETSQNLALVRAVQNFEDCGLVVELLGHLVPYDTVRVVRCVAVPSSFEEVAYASRRYNYHRHVVVGDVCYIAFSHKELTGEQAVVAVEHFIVRG